MVEDYELIYYESLPHIYPDTKNLKIENTVKIPADLTNLIEKLGNIWRYENPKYQPVGSIPDNDKAHTIRLVFRALTLPRTYSINIDRLERMLWVHDIPEILVGDVNAVEKKDSPGIIKGVKDAEYTAAQALLNQQDVELFMQFEEANMFLRDAGKKISTPVMQEAVLARIIDMIDGNLVFYYFYTKWLDNHPWNGFNPPISVFMYARTQYIEVTRNLTYAKSLDLEIAKLCKKLLRQQMEQILAMWESVDKQKIPSITKKENLEIRKLLNVKAPNT